MIKLSTYELATARPRKHPVSQVMVLLFGVIWSHFGFQQAATTTQRRTCFIL
jgi:hypothetical protein